MNQLSGAETFGRMLQQSGGTHVVGPSPDSEWVS